jgi:hypothetical protein
MLDVAAGCKNKAHEARPEIDGYQWRAWAAERKRDEVRLNRFGIPKSACF